MALADELRSFRVLTPTFFARFFESEVTAGFDDLKNGFFWMVAALAAPGMFIPWLMAFGWHARVAAHGVTALREASQAEKTLYLSFTMIASGLVTSMLWSSLLPDRRDTVILGGLPVRSGTVVFAKLAAIGGYLVFVCVAMHGVAAVFFGAFLSEGSRVAFLARGVAAHFIASSAATAGVALTLTTIQGLTLALAGPRVFARLSAALHAAFVALLTAGLAFVPVISFSMRDTVRTQGGSNTPWILETPPAWFLGLYEWLLGTTHPVHIALAAQAGVLLIGALVVTAVTYPVAYHRLMQSPVESATRPGSLGARKCRALLVRSSGTHPEARAAADFYTATLGRVGRHRYVLAIAAGLALAWIAAGSTLLDPSDRPTAGWLSLPLAATVFLVAGLRVAAALPGDIRASWLFELNQSSQGCARMALEHVMYLVAVIPLSVVPAPVFASRWGMGLAIFHAILSLAFGALVVQLLIWRSDSVPCSQRWRLAKAELGYRWPFYVVAFLLLVIGIPRLEVRSLTTPYGAAALITVLACAAAGLRYWALSAGRIPDDHDEAQSNVLSLS
jgi:hypothetical protein